MKRLFGFFLIFISIMLVLYVLFSNSNVGERTQTFSTYTFLTSTWEKYKTQFINKDGRIIDYSQNSITTSEGQSYALLRSVWVDDKQTFDLVWKWTKDTMKRPTDHLFGWRWGKKQDNTYGFTSSADQNSASDADEDIALALILAAHRWGDQSYLTDAKAILQDIWKLETADINGNRVLTAGNWANNNQEIVINPSYFAPYAYRLFAEADTSHDWQSLIQPGYKILSAVGNNPLDKSKGVGLPPDWMAIGKTSGVVTVAHVPNLTTNYSFDAVRVPWRVALDYQWNNTPEAKTYLEQNFQTLVNYYKSQSVLAGVYAHDGSVIQSDESPTMYATALSFLMLTDQQAAKKIYDEKIVRLYSNNTNSFNKDLPYYDQNWLWFGAGLYNKQLKKF